MIGGNRWIHKGIDNAATQNRVRQGFNSALEGANVGQVSCGDDRPSGKCNLSDGVGCENAPRASVIPAIQPNMIVLLSGLVIAPILHGTALPVLSRRDYD